jgi:hypothetical protein
MEKTSWSTSEVMLTLGGDEGCQITAFTDSSHGTGKAGRGSMGP